MLKRNKNSIDPFDYNVSNCGKKISEKITKK